MAYFKTVLLSLASLGVNAYLTGTIVSAYVI